MGRGIKVATMVVVAVAALYAAHLAGGQGSSRQVHSSTSQDNPAHAPSLPVTSPTAPSRIPPQAFSRSEWGYRWDPSRPGIAASEADAAWLQSRGFPGPDVEDHLRRLSMPELEALAARGNHAATAILAYTLAKSGGSPEQVLGLLGASANAGSVYALKTAGDIFMTVDGYRDPAMASAYYGLQARAGDQSGIAQRYLLSNQLDSTRRLQSELVQERLWRSLGSAAQFQPGEEPRPGFDEFVSQSVVGQ